MAFSCKPCLNPSTPRMRCQLLGPQRAAAPAAACVSGEDAAEQLLGDMVIRLLPDMYCVYAEVE